MSSRKLLVAAFVVVIAIGCAIVVLRVSSSAALKQVALSDASLAELAPGEPVITFIDTRAGNSLSAVPAGETGVKPSHYEPRCARMAATELYVVCLERTNNLLWPYQTKLLSSDLSEIATVPLEGVPSRARISPDGKYFATTSFVTGDSYAAELFSTRTVVYEIDDVAKGGQNLESYYLIVNGESYRYTDTNIWGVTFVPGQDRFFATASFSGHRYLVDGSITQRTMLVLRDNAECPSLSPDGLRLAYKKRVTDGVYPVWRFYLLDLTTNTESELAEKRSVDDQIAWLDNDAIMYAVPRDDPEREINDIWSLNVDGGEPQLVIEGGESPTVATYPTAL